MYYSRFKVSSPVCPLHTAITHVIEVLDLLSLTFQLQLARETLQFEYFNHVSGCGVECANGTENPEATVCHVIMDYDGVGSFLTSISTPACSCVAD